ncbi:MAG: hypothetical protein IKN43_00125 [Selenomonadaceae bacterium]|nr:hypothetical protein [Selenomonadaceae bacterium]
MKKTIIAVGIMLALPFVAFAAPQIQPLPPNIFEWVQSSARSGYWFNKQEMYYGIKNGVIDKNLLTVPVMKVYDDVQINEVITKRRWHDASLQGYEILAGAAEYLEFNLKAREVTIKRHEDLDNTWTTLSSEMPNRRVYLDKLSDKNVDKIFYIAILEYADKHKEEILERSLKKGKLPEVKTEVKKDKKNKNDKKDKKERNSTKVKNDR